MRRKRNYDLLDILIAVGCVVCILISVAVMRTALVARAMVGRADATLAASKAVMASIDLDGLKVDSVADMGEAEVEDEAITAALLETGYLSDDIPLDYELQDVLRTSCEAFGVPYHLALGLIETESAFQTDADNGLCYGLCQLNRDYFPDNLTPAENIRAGMEYLGSLLDKHDTVEAALTSYNSGHDTGARGYARAVLERAARWEEAMQ